MGRLLTLDDLHKNIEEAHQRLSLGREEILSLSPLPDDFSHDSYGFSYMRAERIAINIIAESLKETSWLPTQLDPCMEVLQESKQAIKKWLSSSTTQQPNSEDFGNDFVHALTRVALTDGWESDRFNTTALRIGEMFHDLSCLIGLIYYGIWMSENGLGGVAITDPKDLERTAKEIAVMTKSPEIMCFLYQRNKMLAASRDAEREKKKTPPSLRVIKNTAWVEEPPPSLPIS